MTRFIYKKKKEKKERGKKKGGRERGRVKGKERRRERDVGCTRVVALRIFVFTVK